MKKYIALLRGVNVSGHNKIRMAELAALFSRLGFTGVKTHIQSGNVVFTAPAATANRLENNIAAAIEDAFGYKVAVIVRTPAELKSVLLKCPFDPYKKEKSYFLFLSDAPDPELMKSLAAVSFAPEEFLIKGKTVYLYFPQGAGKARLTTAFIEKKLRLQGTARNFNTVTALVAMAAVNNESKYLQ